MCRRRIVLAFENECLPKKTQQHLQEPLQGVDNSGCSTSPVGNNDDNNNKCLKTREKWFPVLGKPFFEVAETDFGRMVGSGGLFAETELLVDTEARNDRYGKNLDI